MNTNNNHKQQNMKWNEEANDTIHDKEENKK